MFLAIYVLRLIVCQVHVSPASARFFGILLVHLSPSLCMGLGFCWGGREMINVAPEGEKDQEGLILLWNSLLLGIGLFCFLFLRGCVVAGFAYMHASTHVYRRRGHLDMFLCSTWSRTVGSKWSRTVGSKWSRTVGPRWVKSVS